MMEEVYHEGKGYKVIIENSGVYCGWRAGFVVGCQTIFMQSNYDARPEENNREYAIWQARCLVAALDKLIHHI